jgi:glutamine cyclotransferase
MFTIYFVIITILSISITCGGINISCAYAAPQKMKHYTVHVVKTIPHNTSSFTQGLIYYDGMLYESIGLYGQSSLQRIDADTGVVQEVLPVSNVFAEGLARWENRLIQLTWKDKTAFIYNLSDFSRIGTFHYETEGWGLTTDKNRLIMSDGTDVIFFRNPFSFETERKIRVTLEGKPLDRINELEYVDGFIYANVWYENAIIQIDPVNGNVVGIIDASPLLRMQPPLSGDSVLNGIAYNDKTQTFYLTGKNWPIIFKVTLEEVK